MSFDWQHYLDLAGELIDGKLSNASKRARYRAAISRAYYGALIPTRDAMEEKLGRRYDSKRIHKDVQADLQSSDSDVCNALGVLFATMVSRRVSADYRSDWTRDDERTALQQLSDARRAMELLSRV